MGYNKMNKNMGGPPIGNSMGYGSFGGPPTGNNMGYGPFGGPPTGNNMGYGPFGGSQPYGTPYSTKSNKDSKSGLSKGVKDAGKSILKEIGTDLAGEIGEAVIKKLFSK